MNTLSTKNTRRIFAALLSAACLLPTLASCGAKQNPASPEAQAENAVQTGYSTGFPDRPRNVPAGYARRAERDGAVGTRPCRMTTP